MPFLQKKSYHVLGVMSGTSLDGIDIAEINFYFTAEAIKYTIEKAETVPYTKAWKQKLSKAILLSEEALQELNQDYTDYLAIVINAFIRHHSLKNIDAVCSHGHTVWHQPEKGVTLQIGNLSFLSEKIQQTVICDFRVQDVALGGQGAPLVPIGDRLLFGAYDYCLNLGGFANVSTQIKNQRIAYDICPVNIVLNKYANNLGFDFDEGGKLAAKGVVDEALLQKLNAIEFYRMRYPKSLGLEWVQQFIFPKLEASNADPNSILRTFIEHIAIQLSLQFKEDSTIFITGGGAYNSFLIERLKQQKSLHIEIPQPQLIEFKEALIFGLLGVLKLRNEINTLASVTGAKKDHSAGVIFRFP